MEMIDHFKMHDAFAHLNDSVLESIASVSRYVQIPETQTIVREGDETSDLFLLIEGEALATRKGPEGGDIPLNTVRAGECLGELAFLDGAPRAASVIAQTACTLIEIPVAALKGLPDGAAVSGELKGALASVVVKRARSLSDGMLSALQEQLAAKTLQNQFGYFLVFTIALYLISTSLFYLVAERYVKDVYDPGFSWQTILAFAVPCLIIIKVMKIPAGQLGLRREGLFRSLAQSFAICLVLSAPALIYLVFFKGDQVPQNAGVKVDLLFLVQYLFHTVIQEIGSRGLLQGLFQKFLADTRGHRAVFLTSTIFASLHLTFGVDAVVITFFASIVFGYVYLYQKNLAGVVLMHYWFGVLAALMVAI
ncbi:cyclic nucleotide-binding domain-containing protein [uncultured Roseibium sp.]|uniref:cyclic nucleotide-binding domain-containing protein n=1 Tax=uncultured Roseibium sp. TaxID=1936171 RepID=UPI002614F8D1|nr:cyclic nucleotide-binding domain-containing protein [uncultured Roseibium sp.]